MATRDKGPSTVKSNASRKQPASAAAKRKADAAAKKPSRDDAAAKRKSTDPFMLLHELPEAGLHLLTAIRRRPMELDDSVATALEAVAEEYDGKADKAARLIKREGLSDEVERLTARLNKSGLTDVQRLLLGMEDVYGHLLLRALKGEHVRSSDITGLYESVLRNIEEEPRGLLEGALVADVFTRNHIDLTSEAKQYQRVLRRVREEGIPLGPGQTSPRILEFQRLVAEEGELPSLIEAYAKKEGIPKYRLTNAVKYAMLQELQGLNLTFLRSRFENGDYDEHFGPAFAHAAQMRDGAIDPIALSRPSNGAFAVWDFQVDDLSGEEAQVHVPMHVRAAGALDYVYCLGDLLGVYRLADALVLRWAAGLLDITGAETSGNLYRYWQVRSDRLQPEERGMLYKRVLDKGDTPLLSRMVANESFPRLWGSLMTKVADYISASEDAAQDTAVSRVPIYRATQDLQYNLTEAMTGMAHMQVTDMYAQLREAFELLGAPEIVAQLSAGRRRNMWAVIDRLCQEELGTKPDISAIRSLAVDGNKVFEWIASFNRASVSESEFEQFRESAEQWIIAAAALGDMQVMQELADPEEPDDPFADDALDDAEWNS